MASEKFEKYINREVLIEAVESRPVIWDKTLVTYKNKLAKAAAWREICSILMDDYEALNKTEQLEFERLVVMKWSRTRDAWIRTINDKKKLGGSSNSRPYIYHDQMLFLKKVLKEDLRDEIVSSTKAKKDYIIIKTEYDDEEVSEEEEIVQNQFFMKNEIDTLAQPSPSKMKKTDCEDRNLLFFKSLLPSLALLDDDQTLEFQSKVINIIQDIKKESRSTSGVKNYTENNQTQDSFSSEDLSDSAQSFHKI